jgi:hypothetical protein
MTKSNAVETTRQRLLVTDPGKTWVLTSTAPDEEPVYRAISGLSIRPIESGGVEVTPLDLGVHNIRTYVTYDYAKSTNNNTGKITFSSRGTKFEVRALTLEDADWLFPGEEFLSLRQLNEAALAN